MTRIPLTPPRSLTLRIAEWYARRVIGTVPDPARALGHHPRILRSWLGLERRVTSWHALDPALKQLALMVSAARIGCSWCLDFGYWEADRLGLPAEKIRQVPAWRDHREIFSDTEQLVMEYAEAMTETPPAVTDGLAAALRDTLGEKAFVELTTIVALENLRSRVNSAFGLTAQGFSRTCAVSWPR
ncbi:carboxymuconolactone decarboxylase family protein [Streptomyces sp. 7-21]|uniref:carboxymuconolactone decarboxylase family protein n=1 Tax=Streptomyces sp. 7-21 TaxID=2802283 RepID=UPI00191EA657|nr:carboxymuconolactone decarboxylase family protein [Streptomyces sp. 7-21]MBL1066080.1 carboxymuconolactone decarboxylase family protein [Streptomyces sp. 7-21]